MAFFAAYFEAMRQAIKLYNPTTQNGTRWTSPRLNWFKDIAITGSTLSSSSFLIWNGTKFVNAKTADITYEFNNIDGGAVNENYNGIGEQIDGGFSQTIF